MRWQRRGRSRSLEDRRGQHSPGRGAGRIPFRLRLPTGRGGGVSLGGLVLAVGVMWLLGGNPLDLLAGGTQVGLDPGALGGLPDVESGPLRTTPQEEELVDFVSFVLDDVQRGWAQRLPGHRDATLVLFRDATRSACGVEQSETGPFYRPRDQQVYVDLARAARAIGDDRLQEMSGRGVRPESFTHGSSAERREWLARGLSGGDPRACDTFAP